LFNIDIDNFVLLSLINTKLRNSGKKLDELCYDLQINISDLKNRLHDIGYVYDEEQNHFATIL